MADNEKFPLGSWVENDGEDVGGLHVTDESIGSTIDDDRKEKL